MGSTTFTGARLAWALFAAVALVNLGIRIHLLDLPLERDEGEFALMGAMILDGTPPYAEAYNLKPPGIYLAYAGVMAVFGRSAAGVHAGLLVVNLAAAFFLYRIVRRSRCHEAAAAAAGAFIALCAMPKALGLSAHATQFLLLPALWGLWLLVDDRTPSSKGLTTRIGWAGFLLGMSALVKQPGFFFVLLGSALAFRQGRERADEGDPPPSPWANLALFLAGSAVPWALSLAWLAASGVFDRFWFWVVEYALEYGTQVRLAEALDIAWSVGSTVAVPALAIFAIAIPGMKSLGSSQLQRGERFLIYGLLIASFVGLAMGFHFRRHYFVLLFPVTAILFGIGVDWIRGRLASDPKKARLSSPVALTLAALAIAHVYAAGWPVFSAPTGAAASRAMFGTNPFVESPMIGEKIREMTKEEDRVAVVGSEPQLYFYSGRRPATGYIYTYSIVEVQPLAAKMRDEMIAEVVRAKPKVFVYVNHPSSWLLRSDSDRMIFWWAEDYPLDEGYELAGVVEIISEKETVSLWGAEAARYTPRTQNYLLVFRRPD